MKVVAKPVDVIALFGLKGVPEPIRFRMQDKSNEYITIKIDKVVQTQREKLAGNHMMVYTCRSCIQGSDKMLVLKYEIDTMKWMLFKI